MALFAESTKHIKGNKMDDYKTEQFLRRLSFVGKNVMLFKYAIILKPEMVSLFDNVRIDDYTKIEGGTGVFIHNNTHIASFTGILGGGGCTIGEHCGISQGVRILTGTERPSGYMSATSPLELRDNVIGHTNIGRITFLGANSVVMPNITIHEGGVVGAGAVVTKDVMPWTIVAGVPAVKIGERSRLG